MRRHAKASSAGSILGQGGSLGSFVRGAFEIRAASGEGKGSGALSKRRLPIDALAPLALLVALTLMPASASAAPTHMTPGSPTSPASCPNEGLRTGPSASLPDCRAYEMVSPVEKNNGDIKSQCNSSCYRAALDQSSLDGDKLTFSAYKAFGQLANSYSNQYLSSRSPSGWSTQGINAPRHSLFPSRALEWDLDAQYKAFSPDLSTAWLTNSNEVPLSSDGTKGIVNLYQRDNATQDYRAMTLNETGLPVSGEAENELQMEGLSSDGTHIVFGALTPLTADAPTTSHRKVYDYSNGALKLVSVLPDGTPNPDYSHVGAWNSLLPNPTHGGLTADHAVSSDGSRIFWTSSNTQFFANPGELYVRIDGERTVLISAEPVFFRTASADGSKVFFETSFHEPYGSLYEFNVDTESKRLIANEERGVLGSSEDASYLYFVSKEQLASGATSGENNLFLDHEGQITFITTLSPADVGQGITLPGTDAPSDVSREPISRSSRVTPDGRHIAFQSVRSLTGYDNTDAVNGEADIEVFTYDADTQQLTCASCNPSGARPKGDALRHPYNGNEELRFAASGGGPAVEISAAAWLNTSENSLYTPRALSADGTRLFFNSFDPLVLRDNNGQQDVYEWEAEGAGSCHEEGGCIRLISTGESPQKSEFIDADPEGKSVFFETSSSIAPQDPGLIDIYVARENGGIPLPAVAPAACEGEACQGPPSPPNDPTPASSAFEGSGNLAKKPASRKRHKKAKKHSKRTHRANHNGRTAR